MANEYSSEGISSQFSFLEHEAVQEHFANLNIKLLKSRHIQSDELYSFELLNDYEAELRNYYLCLYGLNLVKAKHDLETYYYLEFLAEGKGKLSDRSRHKELTPKRVIVGLVLVNIYTGLYFDNDKTVRIEDIYREIQEGEYRNYYKSLLLNNVSENYSDLDWRARVEKPLKDTIKEFEKLGWVKIIKNNNDTEFSFALRESINRFIKLYEYEITNFEEFAQKYNLKEAE